MKISNSVYCVQLHGALKCQLLTIFLIRASSNNYGIRKQLTTTTKLPEMMAALSSDAVVLGSTLPSLCPKHPKIESHGVWKSIKKVPLWTNASYHLLFSSTYRVSQQVLVKILNLREIRILKFFRSKKFVKLKWDLQCLARM